jgi:hypothetical protein
MACVLKIVVYRWPIIAQAWGSSITERKKKYNKNERTVISLELRLTVTVAN